MDAAIALAEGPRKYYRSLASLALNVSLIVSGSFLYVVGLNAVLIPGKLLTGGIGGIAILLHYMFPSVSFGVSYFLLNIPLAFLGWFHISRRFMLYTLFGITIFSFLATTVNPPVPHITDPILTALLSGVICGVGGGLILRSLGSAGGLDILAVALNKKYGLRPGSIYTLANALIIGAGVFFHEFELALYSIIFVFTSGKVLDAVLTGFNRRKSLMVISDHSPEIARQILMREDRGVTYLNGQGAFSGKDKQVIFTITSLTELPKMKEMVFSIDPNAFMVVNETSEVLGRRHGKLKAF